MPVILRLLAAGVPAAKIIAKYAKKAYNAAKSKAKHIGIVGITTSSLMLMREKLLGKKEKDNLRSSKDKKFKGHSSYKE